MNNDFVVTNTYINELGILPYYMTFDGGRYNILFRGTEKNCEKFLESLCNSCCQFENGQKTRFCDDCVNHKWYVRKLNRVNI